MRALVSPSLSLLYSGKAIAGLSFLAKPGMRSLKEITRLEITYQDLHTKSNAIFRYLLFADLKSRSKYIIIATWNNRDVGSFAFYPLNVEFNKFMNDIVFKCKKHRGLKGNEKIEITLFEFVISSWINSVGGKPNDAKELKGSYNRGVAVKELKNKPLTSPFIPPEKDYWSKQAKKSDRKQRKLFNRNKARKDKRHFSTSSIRLNTNYPKNVQYNMFYRIKRFLKVLILKLIIKYYFN